MIPSIVLLAFELYTPQGVYSEIFPSLGGKIVRVKFKFSNYYNDIM